MHGQHEQTHDHETRKKSQQQPCFGLPVCFELSGKRRIAETLEFSASNELGKSLPSKTMQITGAGATKRLVRLRVATRERRRQRLPSPDRARHNENRTYQPGKRNETECLIRFHITQQLRSAAAKPIAARRRLQLFLRRGHCAMSYFFFHCLRSR